MSHLGYGSGEVRRRGALEVVVGIVPRSPGAGGGVNGVQDVEINLRAWTACSIASSTGEGDRLEKTWWWGASGGDLWCRFCAK
jgi:hypothetical protein